MKDRGLKARLLEFYVQNGWYPQLEVDVMTEENTGKAVKLITDIDVLGMYPASNGTFNTVLGDCKTLKNQSPINRVLWMKGLMDFWKADRGIILLQKNIEPDHKQTANRLNITLLSQKDFDSYEKAYCLQQDKKSSAMGKIANWEIYFEFVKNNPPISELARYIKCGFWNEKSQSKNIRKLLAMVRLIKGEFNPDKSSHEAFICNAISLFAISINKITVELFDSYLLPESRENFNEELKSTIWGGYDNYKFLNDIRSKVPGFEDKQLLLPEWGDFVNLLRNFIDTPIDTLYAPIILKELAFELIANENTEYDFLKNIIAQKPHALKCAILIVKYFCKASRLPKEFSDYIVARLMKVTRTAGN